MLLALRRACRSRANFGRRVLVFCDNMVSVLVLDKGRARSYALNVICRRAASLQLACGICLKGRYLETDRNPADEGSRKFGPRRLQKNTLDPVAAAAPSPSPQSSTSSSATVTPPLRKLCLARLLPKPQKIKVLELAMLLPPPGLGPRAEISHRGGLQKSKGVRARNTTAPAVAALPSAFAPDVRLERSEQPRPQLCSTVGERCGGGESFKRIGASRNSSLGSPILPPRSMERPEQSPPPAASEVRRRTRQRPRVPASPGCASASLASQCRCRASRESEAMRAPGLAAVARAGGKVGKQPPSAVPERMQVARDLERVSLHEKVALTSCIARRVRVQPNAIFLEIFSGCGALSRCLRSLKLESFEIEILKGSHYDISCPLVQKLILSWLRAGKVWGLHLGTPCTIWSIARTRVNDSAKNRRKERLGRLCAHVTVQICELASKLGIPWCIENPRTSRIWAGPLHRLHGLPGVVEVFYDACMFGSPFKKPTKLLSTFVTLPQLSRMCDGSHNHILAQGSSKVLQSDGTSKWINRTTQAGAYTDLLCRRWAKLLARAAPPHAAGRDSCRRQEFEDALQHIQDSKRTRSRPGIA